MTEDNIQLRMLRNEDERVAVFDWWAKLSGQEFDSQGNEIQKHWPPAMRAALRHADTPDEALLTDGFRMLWFAIPTRLRNPERMLAWACVAGLVAHIRVNDPSNEIAKTMAQRHDRASDRPRVSELRFRQLVQSQDIVELHRRMRRLLPLLRQDRQIRANVLSLADSILHWDQENRRGPAPTPHRRFVVRWSTAYYTELAEKTAAATS